LPIVRHYLSKKEKKHVVNELENILGLSLKEVFGKVDSVEEVKVEGKTYYAINGILSLFKTSEGKLIPTIPLLLRVKDLNALRIARVVVDMGAIKPITNGADVMIPGIKSVHGDFEVGDLVIVVDEKYGKPICVGIALLDATTVKTSSRGKAIKNIHHIKDEIWELSRRLS